MLWLLAVAVAVDQVLVDGLLMIKVYAVVVEEQVVEHHLDNYFFLLLRNQLLLVLVVIAVLHQHWLFRVRLEEIMATLAELLFLLT